MPVKIITFDSPCDPDEVHQRLMSIVSPGVNFWGTPKPTVGETGQPAQFLGQVHDRKFKIRRIIRYRNSFLPIIRGEPPPVSWTA